MKVIYLGTPAFAVPTLEALLSSKHEVVAVITQPQKQTGRGKKVKMSEVESFARKNNLPVYSFNNISKEGIETLNSIQADILVTCAYGQILSKDVLFAKKHGVINVHGSVLPKYRGASPIQWTIINGEQNAGITILKSDVGMDDGDVLKVFETPVLQWETAVELFDRLSHLAPPVLLSVLDELESGSAVFTPQDHSQATHCKKLTKQMAEINFNQPALSVANLINGINAWPVAVVNTQHGKLKVHKASVVSDDQLQRFITENLDDYRAGQVVLATPKAGIWVKCGSGVVEFVTVQAENGKAMPAKAYLNGKQIQKGSYVNE